MKKIINSKALEVNLEMTKDDNVIIPEDHLWLLSLSKDYWGIHKRVKELIKEYHHPYSNRKVVLELLNKILISDFWIYNEINETDKVVNIFLQIFDTLLKEKLSKELHKQLVFIYLNFFKKQYEQFKTCDSLISEFIQILDSNLEERYFSYLNNISYFIKCLNKPASHSEKKEQVFHFMQKLIQKNIDFWDSTTELEKWYSENKDKFSQDYSEEIKVLGKAFFNTYQEKLKKAKTWDQLHESIFTFSDIIDAFRTKIDIFQMVTDKFYYIFYLLHLPGMIYHRNYLLMDLNRTIKSISSELNEEKSLQSIVGLFSLFADFKESHMGLILDSMLTLGKEIINTKNERLIHFYEEEVIKFGFVSGNVNYLNDDWTLKVDPNHVKNIRVWLEIIEYDPEMMQKLLSALIINLYIGGVFIFDTDLFQKDVTRLLNTRISPIYKRVKQLTRNFPVYFNEIGAEGKLRDVTTKIDELSQRNDKLIHFLRKQTHTEGNNSHIGITYKIIQFWHDLSIQRLKDVIPQNVIDTINVDGIWVKGVHKVLNQLCKSNNIKLDDLLLKDMESIEKLLKKINHKKEKDIKRVSLIIELYQLLKEKYSFETYDISAILRRHNFVKKTDIDILETQLNNQEDIKSLKTIFRIMRNLNEIIFDPAESEGWENIYHKRHIAFGIPSMYGNYREKKFEALGLTFRLENIASIIFERILDQINIDYFTVRTLKTIYLLIHLFREGLALNGIYDQGFDSNLDMLQYSLTSGGFSIGQYANIFQFMESSIKEIINKYFILPYSKLLNIIIPQHLNLDENISEDKKKLIIVRRSEVFFRNLLASAFLVQMFDNFLGKILNNLRNMVSTLSKDEIHNIMNYDPDRIFSPFNAKRAAMDNQIFLGSKAFYLKKLYLWNYPVPPGFAITSEVFKIIDLLPKIASLNKDIDDLLKRYVSRIEKKTDLKYGDPSKPLLLSVRSGSTISMPGMMNTFLNVGLNDEITEKLSKQHNFGWTSWDCYRRLLQTWGMAFGLDRNDFDQIMLDYKEKYKVKKKIGFKPETMRDIAFSYKKLLTDNGVEFESDPFQQLKKAIISVFHSWNTERAKHYRDFMHVADEWGTAVIVQKMVLGNIHRESGSGVLFTHDVNDTVSGINIVGDFSFLSQGEDIVAGLVNPLPVSERQRQRYYQNAPFSLETAFPKIFKKLEDISRELTEVHGFSYQEIEFTFETSEPEDLYILQTRNMKVIKSEKKKVFAVARSEMKRIGCGIGIGNEVLNGAVVFDLEDLRKLKKENPEQNAVLVRPDTVPDDIDIIFECEGLVTGRGGATSHAAVTAANLGKICIVNCDHMTVKEDEKKCIINKNIFKAFDLIAIDATNGIVYKGNYPVTEQDV
ncbi:MAG: hypothetical protein K9N09_11640 [Candidatus Cloacimonetes bacterium]|nr:hypothetical protein [Candidatus Cloacimonadota bacterium]MCF7814665.1 hypothetical protein [Candidatus Cloacimonadota bacterium]MCF7869336.1 hypothetical protein [Candidatus Cloacimonadota bacterium]MCF7884549.1 hypothetical protein [Candidatus Cloacimonadota bacterium]